MIGDKMKTLKVSFSKQSGQSLPMVLILAGVLSILSAALLSLMITGNKFMVKQNCIMMKQELASIALEQTMFKLQQGSNWYNIPISNYNGYQHQFTTNLGSFTVHIVKGNLFLSTLTDPGTRQGQDEYRTIGILVKTTPTACTGNYFAVVQKMKFGGPLVSKGKINLPCTDARINDPNFMWGDIYSGNTNSGYCRIPIIPVAKGTTGVHQEWEPTVYCASDIYTSIGYASGGRTGAYLFATTYEDMSPTAHCHPFSQFATVPEIDLQSFKDLATSQGSYYGPKFIPGVAGVNKNYIDDGAHDNYTLGTVVNDVTQANILKIMHTLRSPSSVLFIDTTDGLPVRSNPPNTYSGSVSITANYATDKTLRFYTDANNQYMTWGLCFIQGPLLLIGDNPSSIATTGGFTWGYGFASGTDTDNVMNVRKTDNYYYPQNDDTFHYHRNLVDDTQSYLTNVKHNGLLYVGGELRIGGPRSNSTLSDVCVYGSIYLGEQGSISMDSSDTGKLYVYFNKDLNFFSMQTNSLQVVSFSDISFLVPTPGITYPASF
jgi:hypothetical protein